MELACGTEVSIATNIATPMRWDETRLFRDGTDAATKISETNKPINSLPCYIIYATVKF